MKFGFTFSTKYTIELGFNWKSTFKWLLSELDVDSVRLCAYWDNVEPMQGEFHCPEARILHTLVCIGIASSFS